MVFTIFAEKNLEELLEISDQGVGNGWERFISLSMTLFWGRARMSKSGSCNLASKSVL